MLSGKCREVFPAAVSNSVGTQQATIVLGVYAVVLTSLTILLFWRRDIG